MAFYNPFRPAYQEDPYPSLASLRRAEPVHHSTELRAWVITAYELANQVLHDDAAFSSNPIHAAGGMGESVAATRASVPLGMAPILGNSDDPEHTRLRAIVNRAFVPRAIEATRPAVQRIVAGLLEGVPTGPIDVMSAVAEPLAVQTVLEHLGIPPGDRDTFRANALAITRARAEGPSAAPEARRAHEALSAALTRWQSGGIPSTTVLGTLLEAAAAGERITADEMLMLLIHISLAGNGPTAYALGNAVLALGTHSPGLTALIDDAGVAPRYVDELLRFDSPTHVVSRFAVSASTVGRRTIRPGDIVYIVVGAANRDPARFPEPDDLLLDRVENRHLSFGMAAHFCLGAPLARAELAIALEALVERFGRFRILEMERGGTFLLRGPRRLVIDR